MPDRDPVNTLPLRIHTPPRCQPAKYTRDTFCGIAVTRVDKICYIAASTCVSGGYNCTVNVISEAFQGLMAQGSQDSGTSTVEDAAEQRCRSFWNPSDWAFSLSFANIVFFRTWADLLQDRHILPLAFATAIFNVLFLAVCIRGAYFWGTRTRSRVVHWTGILAFAGLWLLPFHAITTVHFPDDIPKRNAIYGIGVLVVIGIVVSRRMRKGVVTLCATLALFVAVTFGQAITRLVTYDAARWAEPSARVPGNARSPRLVFIVFDEWDYGLTFPSRKRGVQLPELDRLAGEAFHATKAHPPGATTLQSMPRVITGDMTATPKNIGDRPTVFSRAKQNGLHSVAIGWFLYCNTQSIAKALDHCWVSMSDGERNSMGTTFPEIAVTQYRYLFENQFRSPFGQPIGAKRHALDFSFNRRYALDAVASGGLDFVFIHFNIPHEPQFYDASTGNYHLGEKPITTMIRKPQGRYWDALQLVDRTFGELRRKMEATGMWDNTHVIMTSDHPNRGRWTLDGVRNDNRVPFIVRTAGTSRHVRSDRDFNTAAASDLTMGLLGGQIRSTEEVAAWLDGRAAK